MATATVYTDASRCHQSRRATFAYVVRYDRGRYVHAADCPASIETMTQAELYAVYAGLHNAARLVSDLAYVAVRTDSEAVAFALANPHRAVGAGQRLAERILALGLRLDVQVVKGHQDKGRSTQAYMNDFVHRLAYRQLRGRDPKPTVNP